MTNMLFALLACGGEAPAPKPKPVAEAPKPPPKPAPKPEPKKAFADMTDAEKVAFGKDVYLNSTLACSTCHGNEGKGQAGVFPPLVGQKDHMGDCVNHAAIVIYGMTGEITVDGTKYNGNMTPQGNMLNDDQIAGVISFERTAWGNDYGMCTPEDVKKARAADPRK